jgi:hypothetical protein
VEDKFVIFNGRPPGLKGFGKSAFFVGAGVENLLLIAFSEQPEQLNPHSGGGKPGNRIEGVG